MATVQETALQMRNFGNLDPTRNDPANANNNGKKSEWEKILAQMAMAQKMDARTMAGFALGKLLRQVFDNWKERYDARGAINDWLNTKTPEEIDTEITKISQIDPQRAEYMKKHLAKRRRQNGDNFSSVQPQINTGDTNYAAQRLGWTPQQSTDDGLARAIQRWAQPQSTDSAPVNIDWLGQGDTNSPSPLANWRQQADDAVLPVPQLLDSDKMAKVADTLQFENLPWWLTGVR